MATKKKNKGKKKGTKLFTKQLKTFVHIVGTELILGVVTGIITKYLAEKVEESKRTKEDKAG